MPTNSIDEKTLLPATLQHSVLSLLLFSNEYCQLIRNTIPSDIWGSDQGVKMLTQSVYDFVDNYHKAPGSVHVVEIIHALKVASEVKNNLWDLTQTLEDHFHSVNVEFTLTRLEAFHRQVSLKHTLHEGLTLLERGELASVEEVLHAGLKRRLEVFDPGTTLLDSLTRRIAQNNEEALRSKRIYLGIKSLDERGLVPTPKQLMIWGAGAKKGKSFALIHCTKKALAQGKKVVYITLELDKDLVSERIIQSVYALTKRKVKNEDLTRLVLKPTGFLSEQVPTLPCLYDEETMLHIAGRLEQDTFINRNLYVKEFPMGTLTIQELRAFLDNLEMHQGFIPDMLVVDYAKLMYIDGRQDNRIAIGKNYEALRAIATERNIAVVTATQLNRIADGTKKASGVHVAEDYSIIATADLFITYNQTDDEHALKMARLYVSNARNEEGGFEIYITQDYASSQFVISEQEATSQWRERYDNIMKAFKGEDTKDKPDKKKP